MSIIKESFKGSNRKQKPISSISNEFTIFELYDILKKNPYLINVEDEKNETFLSYAIKRNHKPIINLILTSPILNLSYQNNRGNTYLHLAVLQQNLKLIEELISKGIFLDTQNKDGNTALHLAYYVNNLHIIKILFNGGVDFQIKNNEGLLPEEVEPLRDLSQIAGYDIVKTSNYEQMEEVANLSLKDLDDKSNLKIKSNTNNSGDTISKSIKSKDKKNSSSLNQSQKNSNSISDSKNKSNIFKGSNTSSGINPKKNISPKMNYNYMNKDDINDLSDDLINNNSFEKNEFTGNKNIIRDSEMFITNNADRPSMISNITKKEEHIININQSDNKNLDKAIDCSNKPLYDFLSQIKMQKYYNNLNDNGFDNINIIIKDATNESYLTDTQLKLIGINIPGDRAKILVRIQEKAGGFNFDVPRDVYYIASKIDNLETDKRISKLNFWLKEIKLEQYLKNFVLNGYYSTELILIQSISKNPLTEEILKNELKIDKLGYRARILNKLKEDSKNYVKYLRDSIITFHAIENSKICQDCSIF
jgi:hypothetical protein